VDEAWWGIAGDNEPDYPPDGISIWAPITRDQVLTAAQGYLQRSFWVEYLGSTVLSDWVAEKLGGRLPGSESEVEAAVIGFVDSILTINR